MSQRINHKSLPVGVFDSGVGGLTVLKALRRALPAEDFLYYADTAHVPYGEKKLETVLSYVQEIIFFLLEQRVKAIVMGCNLSSCIALEWARKNLDIPVFALVEQACQGALQKTKSREIGVICTPATAECNGYAKELQRRDSTIKVHTVPCQPFVPLVEAGQTKGEEVEAVIRETLQPLLTTEVDTLIYGCSHYPFLSEALSRVLPDVQFVDPALTLSQFLRELWTVFEWGGEGSGEVKYFASGSSESLYQVGEKFLGEKISEVESLKDSLLVP